MLLALMAQAAQETPWWHDIPFLAAILAGAGAIVTFLLVKRREVRTDAITELTRIIQQKDADINDLRAQNGRQQEQINTIQTRAAESVQQLQDKIDDARGEWHKRAGEFQERMSSIQAEHVMCVRENGDLRREVAVLQVQLHALSRATGANIPEEGLAGIVVVSQDGVVTEASPALTPFLGWQPKELLGQSIEKIVPPRLLEAHRTAFQKAAAAGFNNIVEDKVIETFALVNDDVKSELAVRITLRGWRTRGGEGFITATIRPRQAKLLRE